MISLVFKQSFTLVTQVFLKDWNCDLKNCITGFFLNLAYMNDDEKRDNFSG